MIIFRASDIILIAIMVSAAAFTYKTKHEAESWQRQTSRLQQQIHLEEDTIDLLKADWSLLTQPARLQRLAEIYGNELELAPVEARQIIGLNDLPAKPPLEGDGLSGRRTDDMADNGRDRVVTGAIAR